MILCTLRLDGIKEYVDLFLADYKMTDPQKHKHYTGVDPKNIYKNLQLLHSEGKKVLLRCPIICGVNDDEEHLKAIASLTKALPRLIGAELLPYHRLGIAKVKRFGLESCIMHEEYETPSREKEQKWINTVRSFGGRLINEDVL